MSCVYDRLRLGDPFLLKRRGISDGKVKPIRSDNGTNFCVADKELRKALEKINQE